ncbi:MAG: DUF423 domain-containing protein [Phycisphaerae bacterium]
MSARWVMVAAVYGLVAVAAGAFGAHVMKHRFSEPQLAAYEVAVRYQMYHALALLGVAWIAQTAPSRIVSAAGACMTAGVLLFSGSIYGLVFTAADWLGPVTPAGGALLIAGWLLLAIAACRRRRTPAP